ncbi:MAG: hypothetical protein FK734_17555, partial [Asgard group archaeon]|nr:hypothetical protein [Asgard group archaeon]
VTKPTSRSDTAIYYDPEIDGVILFGGSSETSALFDDTWIFFITNKTWVQVNPDIHPGSRYGAEMFYDAVNKRGILFGGRTSITYTDETWSFDSSTMNWTLITTEHKPVKRYWYNLALISDENQAIIYGGRNDGYLDSALNDLVEYNITQPNWENIDFIGNRPSPRFLSSMVYHEESKMIFLFGGTSGFTNLGLDDMWFYSLELGIWLQITNSSTPTEIPMERFVIWIITFSAIFVGAVVITLTIRLLKKRKEN